ncbi:MAG TPA: carbonic anhydrase, partial [Cyclobacteriaceae bacterium]|nr:carbonic anhydrase [Cyclobacteriaceae bacterium]
TYRFHQQELEMIPDMSDRADRLAELSVKEQVMNLAKTSIIQHAWKTDNRPMLHGWIYRLSDGILHNLVKMDSKSNALDPIYQYEMGG